MEYGFYTAAEGFLTYSVLHRRLRFLVFRFPVAPSVPLDGPPVL